MDTAELHTRAAGRWVSYGDGLLERLDHVGRLWHVRRPSTRELAVLGAPQGTPWLAVAYRDWHLPVFRRDRVVRRWASARAEAMAIAGARAIDIVHIDDLEEVLHG